MGRGSWAPHTSAWLRLEKSSTVQRPTPEFKSIVNINGVGGREGGVCFTGGPTALTAPTVKESLGNAVGSTLGFRHPRRNRESAALLGLAKLRPRGAYRGHVAAGTSLPPPPPPHPPPPGANEPMCAMLRWKYCLTFFLFCFLAGGGGNSSREPARLQGGTVSCPAPSATMSNTMPSGDSRSF